MDSTEIILRLTGIAGVLLLFGLTYSYIIAKKPFRPRMTWLSVVFGDFVTASGCAGALLLITDNQNVIPVPFVALALTGGPMILGQLTKHDAQNGGSITILDEDEDIDGD